MLIPFQHSVAGNAIALTLGSHNKMWNRIKSHAYKSKNQKQTC